MRQNIMRTGASLLSFCVLLMAESFSAGDVAILGDLDYEHTSEALECPAKQKFCSLLFNGLSGDRVQVVVRGGEDKPFVALADGSLTELARGSGEVSATLPEVADRLATYYIVFRDVNGKPGRFTVQLKKVK
ncbi:MAG TPA: hypothetical protein VEQ63_06030 [Bryobacteraceae bacterium]|nr:hypothetical protein [Bryobacteraceae bacterium]